MRTVVMQKNIYGHGEAIQDSENTDIGRLKDKTFCDCPDLCSGKDSKHHSEPLQESVSIPSVIAAGVGGEGYGKKKLHQDFLTGAITKRELYLYRMVGDKLNGDLLTQPLN